MLEKKNLGDLFHKTKDRIRELGEVFTPEEYVESMLDLLAKGKRSFWEKEDIAFFEPTCGHGNIIIPLLNRRLKALYGKAQKENIIDPELYSIAYAINTLWAIDIDNENIEQCKERVFHLICSFIETTQPKIKILDYIEFNIDFFSHVLCAINWHIFENEALSSLSNSKNAFQNAKKTKIGSDWYDKNEHLKMEFNLSWAQYYKDCDDKNLAPIIYEKSIKFLEDYFKGKKKRYPEFSFADSVFSDKRIKQKNISNSIEVVA